MSYLIVKLDESMIWGFDISRFHTNFNLESGIRDSFGGHVGRQVER